MSNNSLFLVDPNFKADASVNCNLLLKITNDSFSYAVVNKESEQINVIFDKQGCKDVEHDLKTAFETDHYLSQKYRSVKATVHTLKFLFIPDEWHDADNPSAYSKYLNPEGEVYSRHNGLGFSTVFCLDEKLKEKLPVHTMLFPQSEPLLILLSHLGDDALLFDFTAGSFSVLFVKGKKINFHNHYQAESVEEFNYFLLLIIDQLDLNDTIPVYIQGIIDRDDGHYNCMQKYFNKLDFFLLEDQQDSELLNDMPKHYFSGLLALDLCE